MSWFCKLIVFSSHAFHVAGVSLGAALVTASNESKGTGVMEGQERGGKVEDTEFGGLTLEDVEDGFVKVLVVVIGDRKIEQQALYVTKNYAASYSIPCSIII